VHLNPLSVILDLGVHAIRTLLDRRSNSTTSLCLAVKKIIVNNSLSPSPLSPLPPSLSLLLPLPSSLSSLPPFLIALVVR
jgi:hypothetical protein